MLNRLFKVFKKEKDEPSIDLSLGYTRLSEFKAYLLEGSYSLFEEEYEKLDWDAKTLLNEGIGLDKSFADIIEKWAKRNPESYIARLFAGVSCTCLAWIARSSVAGKDVSASRAESFLELLEAAVAHLKAADELNAEDAEICARTIRVYMGLGVEKETVSGFFEAATEIEPNHLMAHLMMINYLTPKWRGSIDEMYEFANQRYEETGSSLLVVLKLFAITEEWKYYDMMEEKDKVAAFFKNTELKSRVMDLYAGYTEDEEDKLLIPYVYNYFAFLLYMFNEKVLTKQAINKIDGKITVYPWAYLGIENNKQLLKL